MIRFYMKISTKIGVLVCCMFMGVSWGQETIGTETINVVKLYSPTISDANKIKDQPVLEVEKEVEKEKITYSIFSYPVASTFSPSKTKPESLDRVQKEKLFSSYLTMGFGNYSTPLVDFYTAHKIDREAYVGGYLNHLSSWGDIEGELLQSPSSVTQLGATYGVNKQKFGWNMDVGYRHQLSHWYGIPSNQDVFTFPDTDLQLISPAQNYQAVFAKANMYSKTGFFRQMDVQYSNFSDALSSTENRFLAAPVFDFKVEKQKIKTEVLVDYVGTNFSQDYLNTTAIKSSNVIVGATPSIVFRTSEYSFNLGAGIFYDSYSYNNSTKGKIYVYPQITASYQLIQEYLTAYAGAEGGLIQNSYQQMVRQNPFVSPTLSIAPTDQAYNLYIGFKGKIVPSLQFDVKGFYFLENEKALFVSNKIIDQPARGRLGYQFANSFGVVYDDVRTTGASFGLKYSYEKQFSIEAVLSTYSYTTDLSARAWNLPQLTTSIDVEYNITDKWELSSKVFYVGERQDFGIINSSPNITYNVVTLKSYVDANLKLSYKYNSRLTGFLQANNIANQGYEKWMNYSVQQFQALVGASYKFGK